MIDKKLEYRGTSRNTDNWTQELSEAFADRGFTGHEHLPSVFGLIDMNGRMYDPKLGQFLSPDPIMQSPGNSQNFNRYSYCLNNPLLFTDPSGYVHEQYQNELPDGYGQGDIAGDIGRFFGGSGGGGYESLGIMSDASNGWRYKDFQGGYYYNKYTGERMEYF